MKTLTRLWSKLVRWECAWVEAQMFDDTVILLMVQKPGWPVNMRIINHYLQGLYYTSQVVSRNYSIKDVLKVVLLYKHYLAIFLTVVICLFWFLWNFASGCRVAGCRQCGLTTTTTTTTTRRTRIQWPRQVLFCFEYWRHYYNDPVVVLHPPPQEQPFCL